MVFASFIRKAADVEAVRRVLGDEGKHILIISKVTPYCSVEFNCSNKYIHACRVMCVLCSMYIP